MRLVDLCSGWLDVPSRPRRLDVHGIACDSRQVRRGDVFVAVSGPQRDGHDYAGDAVKAGAALIVGERRAVDVPSPAGPYLRVSDSRVALGKLCHVFYGEPSRHLEVVGVTGTKGKTTTCWILDEIVRRCGGSSALFGTVENRVARRAIPSTNTTPGCLALHVWLREHVDAAGSHAVVEVSSHAIRQRRIAGIRFVGGIFTNIAPEHLDYHSTFEDYFQTKRSFFAGLPSGAFAVLSREDPKAQGIAKHASARIVWYGAESQDGVESVRLEAEGSRFLWKGVPASTRLVGYHNLLNVLAAATAAESLGFDRRDVAAALENVQPPPGRLEEVAGGAPFRVIVDYAHTDGALEAVLTALRPVTKGRLITVFGCGGDRDRTKRPRMGRVAERGSDQLIITSDNPRTEPPTEILKDITDGLRRPDAAVVVEDRREAIGLGIRMAREGDTVLIAGKGHETYQEFDGRTVHFDDRKVAREFLNGSVSGPTI